jgi:hypothetical protein
MRIREAVASIALAAPLAGCCPRDEIWRSRTATLPIAPSPDLMMLIAACEAVGDCEPLCLWDWNEYAPNHYPDYESEVRDCEVAMDDETGAFVVSYDGLDTCVAGRRPARFAATRRTCPPTTRTGAWLAEQAMLEAASVRAFADLLGDLIAHRAPTSLRRATIRAAGDEVRHAAACARLARRHGARVRPLETPAAPRRSLRQLAIDNAVEGCVRETYGAVVAGYQARAAADPAIAAAMTAIARDEAAHARVAWTLHRWLAPRLSPSTRDEVAAASQAARAELRAGAGTIDPTLARVAGLPGRDVANHMLDALDASVWPGLTTTDRGPA